MRFYHGGPDALDLEAIASARAVDDDEKAKIKKETAKHHPLTQPNREQLVAKDGKLFLKKPGMYCQLTNNGDPIPELVEWTPGSITIGLLGYGFFVVPPGGHVDIDTSILEAGIEREAKVTNLVKSHAPHLLTEAEMLLRKPAPPAKSAAKQ